jgi:oligopeptide transport system ATP-binding protein
MMNTKLIQVKHLRKDYFLETNLRGQKSQEMVTAVNNVSFNILRGETMAVVGESGCGKTTLGLCILQIRKPTSGKVFFDDADITRLTGQKLHLLRMRMQMIFQDPTHSLNPRMTIGKAISEGLIIHNLFSGVDLDHRVCELMTMVGLNPMLRNHFPYEFSRGQRQRVGIARAISLNPEFIVCDEPISALDISIQTQIIHLLVKLQNQLELTYLYISPDFPSVKHISNRIAVMYLGKLMEIGKTQTIFSDPLHPYTQALLFTQTKPKSQVRKTASMIPSIRKKPTSNSPVEGCIFHPHCPIALDICTQKEPEFRQIVNGHFVACHRI